MRRRIKQEWQVTDRDGRATYFTPVTKKGLQEALEMLAIWTEEWEQTEQYKSFDETDEDQLDLRDDMAPRIELYEQYQEFGGFAWEQYCMPTYYCPIDQRLPKKAQRLWDNK